MCYYTGTWRATIEAAKLQFQKFVVLQNAFPTREEHIGDAHEILYEIISTFQGSGRIFDQGYFSIHLVALILLIVLLQPSLIHGIWIL